MKKITLILIFACTLGTAAAKRPKLIVNIVVSQMRYDYLKRFEEGFGDNGFRLLAKEGINYTDAHYFFSQTNTPATLATLATGAYPDMHGVTSSKWIDYTTNKVVSLIEDNTCDGLDCDLGIGRYSPANLVLPTIGEKLLSVDSKSKSVTIALDPASAILLGGKKGDVYWLDKSRATWISSTAYMNTLPEWILKYNRSRPGDLFTGYHWTPWHRADKYVNTHNSVIDFDRNASSVRKTFSKDYPVILKTPAGNLMVREFAKQAIIYESLGKDNNVDLLNICFDATRFIGEEYGSRSMEIEDAFYRLDEDIADLIRFIDAQMSLDEVLIVVTSDHGASDGYKGDKNDDHHFDPDLFRLLVNGFIGAQYVPGDWVIDLIDGQLYLNHNLIFSRGISLTEVQDKIAAFALQFRGISHAISASSLSGSYLGSGYAQKMQRSFYPKRSGDMLLNLMPGWTYENGAVSRGGSMYEYDTHVPLFFLGSKIPAKTVTHAADRNALAPTISFALNIGRPFISEASALEEIMTHYGH